MRKVMDLAAITVMALGMTIAQAQEAESCGASGVQSELNECAYSEWQAADAALNGAYTEALATAREIDAGLPEAEQGAEASLRAAQRAWVAYRDAACETEGYLFKGGSAEPMVVLGCKAALTRARTDDLVYLVDVRKG
jgi:uncharacterized protein YecT (DUF1311 family)